MTITTYRDAETRETLGLVTMYGSHYYATVTSESESFTGLDEAEGWVRGRLGMEEAGNG